MTAVTGRSLLFLSILSVGCTGTLVTEGPPESDAGVVVRLDSGPPLPGVDAGPPPVDPDGGPPPVDPDGGPPSMPDAGPPDPCADVTCGANANCVDGTCRGCSEIYSEPVYLHV